MRLDDERIEPWRVRWVEEGLDIPPKFRFSRSNMEWRYRNFRIIMYRPFVIRQALQARNPHLAINLDPATQKAVDRCLHEAKESIFSIHKFWMTQPRHCLGAWYSLYHLFQASLIPCVCLRNNPASEQADSWRQQILTALEVTKEMFYINPAARECHRVILQLCSDYLSLGVPQDATPATQQLIMNPIEESPQTQLEAVYSMMWPNANFVETDTFMQDQDWNAFVADSYSDSTGLPADLSTDFNWT